MLDKVHCVELDNVDCDHLQLLLANNIQPKSVRETLNSINILKFSVGLSVPLYTDMFLWNGAVCSMFL